LLHERVFPIASQLTAKGMRARKLPRLLVRQGLRELLAQSAVRIRTADGHLGDARAVKNAAACDTEKKLGHQQLAEKVEVLSIVCRPHLDTRYERS